MYSTASPTNDPALLLNSSLPILYSTHHISRECTWTYNEKCYNYVGDSLDWNTAEAICNQAYGGHLVNK